MSKETPTIVPLKAVSATPQPKTYNIFIDVLESPEAKPEPVTVTGYLVVNALMLSLFEVPEPTAGDAPIFSVPMNRLLWTQQID